MSLANASQLEIARALPIRHPNGKKGKAFIYVTREALPLLFDSNYQIDSGIPAESEVLSLRYHMEMDRYEFLVESPFLPLVAEGAQVPWYTGITLKRRDQS